MLNITVTFGMEERAKKLNAILLAQEAGFQVEYIRAWKNNRELEGYTLKSPENSCAATVYHDSSWYSLSDDEVVAYLINLHRKRTIHYNGAELQDREFILSNILPRLVSEHNDWQLESRGIAHMKFLDMEIIFYIPLNILSNFDEIASVQVTNQLLKNVEISLAEAYSAAVSNLEAFVEVKSMDEMLAGMAENLGIPFVTSESSLPLWVCTTKNRLQGAATILCRKVLDCLENKISGNIAILPSSIHEVIAIKYNSPEDLEYFSSMVREINATEVSLEEKLTDSIYLLKNKQLMLAV